MKLHAALIDSNMDYLFTEAATSTCNAKHSKELVGEL
jgi:hypothetical protein